MFCFDALAGEREFSALVSSLRAEKKPVLVSGVASALKPIFTAALVRECGGKAVVILPEEKEARNMASALSAVFPHTLFFPVRDWSLVSFDAQSRDFAFQRLLALSKIVQGEFDVIVTTSVAFSQETVSQKVLKEAVFSVSVGMEFSPEELVQRLVDAGFSRTSRVEGEGQFARRGDILDLFVPGEEYPVRIEFFGDEIDAMGSFDLLTQRRIENRGEITVLPASEIFFSKAEKDLIAEELHRQFENTPPAEKERRAFIEDLFARMESGMDLPCDLFFPLFGGGETLADYLKDAVNIIFEQKELIETVKSAKAFLDETIKDLFLRNKTLLPPENSRLILSPEEFCACMENRCGALIENFFVGKSPIAPSGIFSFRTRDVASHFGNLSLLEEELRLALEEGGTVCMLCENSLAVQNMAALLADRSFAVSIMNSAEENAEKGRINLLSRSVLDSLSPTGGFELCDTRFSLLTDSAPVRAKQRKRAPKSAAPQEKLLSYADLKEGDYVVHVSHGVGKYLGTQEMKSADGARRDFLKIAYAGSDVLYVPTTNLDSVSKYIGPRTDTCSVKLNRLGGTDWQKAKARAKAGAKDIAKNLIALYAERQNKKGFAFSPDSNWQAEFEEAFPYGETDSQLRATKEIKADMEKPVPMDRILCGDVGFGKTEVALRGVFKALMDNKQAAVLVPTTILAWQHYQTMLSRFKGYPVKIEMLSRFRTKKEQEKVLEKLKGGAVDVVVGTHRLLQKDVEFKDLGLLVIDEEQRFGVTHKERLKEMSRNVDVLTLTATPIPRTLNMALSGIRDMSVLEEAPGDRFPVQTYVLEYDFALIAEAIRRELRRGGQVFYLHNNIEELLARRAQLEREFPDVPIAVAHGKLDKDSLSDIWKEMMDKEISILCCTTIIETGIDLPDANTLIIENADHFGLSQLHQIRGRVGRSDRKAWAYLTYRRGKTLSEIAEKRLEAIREYTEFGSGFKIALRDLELRGAGNLLGAQQHGHLDAVGYDLYMKILSEAVLEEKGEVLPPSVECTVDLPIDGFLPESYVSAADARIDIYRKIASAKSDEELDEVRDELFDRFGDIPRAAENLFKISKLRTLGEKCLCTKIFRRDRKIVFLFSEPNEAALALLSAVYASSLHLSLGGTKPYMELRIGEKESMIKKTQEALEHLLAFAEELSVPQNP